MRGFEKLARHHRLLARWASLVDITTEARAILGDTDLVIWDIGAAWGLPPHLLSLQRTAGFHLIEPDPDAAMALETWHTEADDDRNVQIHCVGVSEFGGPQNLYAYDGDPTGASLLQPLPEKVLAAGPPNVIPIETSTLKDLIDASVPARCDFAKLDIQGAELSALRGAGRDRLDSLLGCELEIGMPGAYAGQPSLEETRLALEDHGLELVDIRPARSATVPESGVPSEWLRSYGHSERISEVDALFLRRPAAVANSAEVYARMSVILATYGFFVDAGNLVKAGSQSGVISPSRDGEMMQALDSWLRYGYRDLGLLHKHRQVTSKLWATLSPSPVVSHGRTLWRWSAD
jgi:FkbM family methyltransferase